MKIPLILIAALALLAGCSNLPKPGAYVRTATGDHVYALFTGEEKDVNAAYPGSFTKQDFIVALGNSPSAEYMTAGRPRYYTVLGSGPGAKTQLRVITLEILERDYQRQ